MPPPGSGHSSTTTLPIDPFVDPHVLGIIYCCFPPTTTIHPRELNPTVECDPGDELLTSAPTPTVASASVTYAGPMDDCILRHGCGRGACIPQRKYDRGRIDPLTEVEFGSNTPVSMEGMTRFSYESSPPSQSGLSGCRMKNGQNKSER